MRIMSLAGAAVAVSLVASTSSFAQAQQETFQQAFNRCVKLAMERGFSTADLDGGAAQAAARAFVIKCMQGQQN
jgi:hypothetical protein